MRRAEAVRARRPHFANAFGPSRQSSAALGRATGARPAPHSTRFAHHFSADRVIVTCASLSRGRGKKSPSAIGCASNRSFRDYPRELLEQVRSSARFASAATTPENSNREKNISTISRNFATAVVRITAIIFSNTARERKRELTTYVMNGAKTVILRKPEVSWWSKVARSKFATSCRSVLFSRSPHDCFVSLTRVCACRVCSWSERINRWWSCEEAVQVSSSTMASGPSNVGRTVFTDDRIRGKRVLWSYSPRIFRR